MNKQEKNNSTISGKKKILFNAILIAIPLIILCLLEVGLRLSKYGADLRLFEKSDLYPGYQTINNNVNYRYFNKVGKTSPTSDIFLTEKPDSCFRIFVFGESSTRGFPYQAGTSFPRILYFRLQDAFPGKRIEVINLSASAITSYSVVDMLGEVLKTNPDAILYYGGHNEYYGALGVSSVESGGNYRWMKKIRMKLIRFRTVQLIQNTINKSKNYIMAKNNQLEEQATLMERIVKDKDIPYGSPMYKKGIDQFEANMEEFVKRAKAHNVPVILSELVNNVKDLPPLMNIDKDGTQDANAVYREAQKMEEQGNYDEARKLYYKAKDLDAIRFRSPEEMNEIVYSISRQYNVPVVPMKKYFEENSPNGLIGNTLMTDHLHPNVDGYFIMADAFFNTLRASKLISDNWNQAHIKPSAEYRHNWGFTELDSLVADLNIQYLKNGWPYKPESAINRFLENYKCKDYVDSMAFEYVTSNTATRHIEDKHIELATHYAKLGMNDKAFEEYYSMIKIHPYINDLYYDASKYLIAEEKYQKALDLIMSMPSADKTYYYYYMTGTLRIKTNDTKQGIKDLEYALEHMTPDAKVTSILLPLYVAYRQIGDQKNETRIYELIKQLKPDFAPAQQPQEASTPKTVVKKFTIDEAMNKAEELIQQKDFKNATDILLAVNKNAENTRANKLLSAIYLMQNDKSQALEYGMKVYKASPNDIENTNNLYILALMKNDTGNAAIFLNDLRSSNIDREKLQRLEQLYNKKVEELKKK